MSSAGDISPSPSPQPYGNNGYQNGHQAAGANGAATPNGNHAGLSGVVRKKLMGYVGFANLPNQVHRKSIRKGFQFTCMVVGTFLAALFSLFADHPTFSHQVNPVWASPRSSTPSSTPRSTPPNPLPSHPQRPPRPSPSRASAQVWFPRALFSSLPLSHHTRAPPRLDIEENGVRLRLTVVDTPGFGDYVNNDESWKPIVENIEARFDAYLEQENRVNRQKMADNRVHACLYFIQPTGHA